MEGDIHLQMPSTGLRHLQTYFVLLTRSNNGHARYITYRNALAKWALLVQPLLATQLQRGELQLKFLVMVNLHTKAWNLAVSSSCKIYREKGFWFKLLRSETWVQEVQNLYTCKIHESLYLNCGRNTLLSCLPRDYNFVGSNAILPTSPE